MRASRLLSILTTLQARGQVTAPELAESCEVSVRTIYRDFDALSAAGVPVYADRGAEGGYRLLDGYRVRLNGLSPSEAEALFLTGLPEAASDLGLDVAMAAAQTKLLAALPANLRGGATKVRQRFHVDAPAWFSETEQPPHLRTIASALMRETLIEIRYQSWKTERRQRLAPLGLVLKAGQWYLIGSIDQKVRTYRASRVLACRALNEAFPWPEDFDLAGYWRHATQRLEAELYPSRATLRVSPLGVKLLEYTGQPYVKARTQLSESDESGWRTAIVPFGTSLQHAAVDFLRLGPEAEVLGPPELRSTIAALTASMAAHYKAGAKAKLRRKPGARKASNL